MTYQPSYQLKLDRASEHLEAFEEQERIWSKSNPCRTWTEFDLQSGQHVLWAEVLKPPPAALGPIVGDCLHNLRSALDNLAFELALAHMGSSMSKSIAGDSGFPIFRAKSRFDKYGKPMIRGIHPDARTRIRGLQPYNRGEKRALNDTLWVLSQLSNADKHQLPHLAVAIPGTISWFTTDPAHTQSIEPVWEPLEGRAIIARFSAPLGRYTQVDVQRPPSFRVGFGERSPDVIQGWAVWTILTQTRDYITKDVVPPLVRYLA